MTRKVRNCCETCENLVCVATTIGQLQHTEYLKPTFLDTFKWAIRPVFPETVTFIVNYQRNLDDITKGLYLEVYRTHAGEIYRIKYITVNVDMD